MISVTILVKDREDLIASCLDALTAFPEVILVDTGSKDKTLSIAKTYPNVKIFSKEFIGFGPLHNIAIELASHDWIFSIDSDEVLSKEASDEILSLSLDPKAAYTIPRHNYFHGKRILGCGWKEEWQVRLFHKNYAKFSEDYVHEKVLTNNLLIKKIKAPMRHYSHRDISDLLHKMQTYTALYVDQNKEKKSSLFKAILRSYFAFFRAFFLRGGIFDGKEGYLLAKYMADSTFYKYARLMEASETS
ncbi:MAG: glycosyltransferase family 2 protein [Verrucomicrobia bacterium]|nr:glycosyltransferase family 2 protein [Verrucomicrobiota bacterium]